MDLAIIEKTELALHADEADRSVPLHSLSILSDCFEIACGSCKHIQDAWGDDLNEILQVDPCHPGANQSFFCCPDCNTWSRVVLDRLLGIEARYAIH